MVKVTRSVQYRYLNTEVCGTQAKSLIGILQQAMQSSRDGSVIGEAARARVADLEQSGQLSILNRYKGAESKDKAFSGQLILYRKGHDVPSIEEQMDSDKSFFDIVHNRTDGTSKPIEGALYFVAIGNHVGIISSRSELAPEIRTVC